MTDKPTPAPDEAVIYRDDWGVPHIYAGSLPAAFHALGYAQAEDRPERTLWLFAFARGEAAAQAGASALETDVRNRLWRHREMAARGVARLSPELRAIYDAYLAGIRVWFERHPTRLPEGAVLPDIVDVLAVERAAFFSGYQAALAEAKCRLGGAATAEPAGASNGWAVAPHRTAAGALILAADPHVQNKSAFYYEYRIEAGDLKSAGFSLGPFLWQAQTRSVSWAMTTGGPDVVDVYEVEVDPADPGFYRFDGERRAFLTRPERFEVKGAPPVDRVFEYTMHNGVLSPVIERRGAFAYVASAPAMDHAGRFGREILAMNRARDVHEVRAAMAGLGMFQQNVVVGDRQGNLLYVRAGAAAIRPDGYDWQRPVPGNSSATAWRGLHPLDDLLQVINPAAGYLQNNNVAPDTMFATPIFKAGDYPVDLFNDRPGRITSRGVRTVQVLEANASMTLADAFELAMDETWVSAPDWIGALAHGVAAHPAFVAAQSEAFRRVLERLLSFDGVAARDSKAAAAFLVWREGTDAVLARPDFADLRAWPWNPTTFTPSFGMALLQQLETAIAAMQSRYGGVDVALGDIRRIGRGARSWPIGGLTAGRRIGDPPTLPIHDATMRAFDITGGDPAARQTNVRVGSQAMRLVSFTDPIQSYSLYAFGQSDDPASAHYDDQAQLFSERRMKPVYFEFAELADHIESATALTLPQLPE